MAFDPDAYLRNVGAAQSAPPSAFDPDAYLRSIAPAAPAPAKGAPVASPAVQYLDVPEGPDLATMERMNAPTNAMSLFAPAQPSNAMARLGQGAVSLADVTLGSVAPSLIGMVGYPIARAGGQTPEQATATVQRFAAPFEKPFGRAFGVTETAGYQQEASRQLMDFIGQNVEKGAGWIAERTGLPEADVANMIGTLTLAAPGAIKGTARAAAPAVRQAVSAAGEALAPVTAPVERAFAARRERIAQERSAESYAAAPRIEAAQDANRLGIVLNPGVSNPVLANKLRSVAGGGLALDEKLSRVNETRWSDIAKKELGLAPEESLARSAGAEAGAPTAFDKARAQVAEPYDRIRALGVLQPDDAVLAKINEIRKPNLIGDKATERALNELIADANDKISRGLTGADALENISKQRQMANGVLSADGPIAPEARAAAEARLTIANALEELIDANVSDPKLLGDFRRARKVMAKSYAWESATDLNTGLIDPTKIARMTARDNALDGDIAAVGRIAANFPEISKRGPSGAIDIAVRQLSRSRIPGTLGAGIGAMTGVGSLVGGTAGAAIGEIVSRAYANRLVKPELQAKVAVPTDYRIPRPPEPAPASVTNNLPVLYDWQNAVSQTPPPGYVPNWVYGRPDPYVEVRPPTTPPQLPAPSATSTMETIAQRRAYDLDLARYKAQQTEQQAIAEAAASRRPAGEGMPLELDPFTGKLRPASQGLKGATPETFSDYGANLNAAAQKIQTGQRATLTAEEKIAWDKRKVDLAGAVPGIGKLSDAALAEKAMDREWVADAMRKARDKAAAFDLIAQRSRDRQAALNAQAQRERMLDLADQLEEQLRPPRPVRKDTQGRKTMEFKRNQLAPKTENKLIEGE